MTYQQTLDWMFAQLPMYQQSGGVALKKKLDNILGFSEHLGNPHQKFKSIHVAGTNGKGSSCHMLASILQEAGYRVGLYTSPHLKDFRERIKSNGVPVSKKYVKQFISTHHTFLERHQLSFFEMTVGMAFDFFSMEKVDIAIIEVGLGGRLDSTNIIVPEVCLITNIGYDHMQFLGNTLQKIALEKAGIIKKNVPVVISESQQETMGIFKMIAAQHASRIVFADQLPQKNHKTDLLGAYQTKNSTGVVAVLNELKGFVVSESHIAKGLQHVVKNTGLLGRWQVLGDTPTVVCDTAHNREGLTQVLQQIERQVFDDLHLVLGFVNDKEIDGLLALFPPGACYYFVCPQIPRGLPAVALQQKAMAHGLRGKSYDTVKKGLKRAMKAATAHDFVFVGGSTFVVAEVV
ncbi:MAG: folylpolyglutamate synthase/dihydrofolate synthase family protein [Bacteroidota bacterium]